MDGMEERFALIEKRLSALEAQTNIRRPLPGPPSATPVQSVPQKAGMRPMAPPVAAKPGNWLGIIAVICFVLAAAFIIKLSIESGWLTPGRQIGLAVLFGFGLIGTGLKFKDLDQEYTSLLPGAGVIVLYLTAFAAHRMYSMIKAPWLFQPAGFCMPSA